MSRRARRDPDEIEVGWGDLVDQVCGRPKFLGEPRPRHRRNCLNLAEAALKRVGEERLAAEVAQLIQQIQ